MADALLVRDGPVNSPLDYVVPAAAEAVPRNISATFADPTNAGPYIPALEVVTPGGQIIGPFPLDQQIAAGASARVSWFRGVGAGGTFTPTPGTGVPPADNLDGWVFRKTNLAVTAVGHGDASNVLLQGNTIALDGTTSILVEVYCPCIEINNGVLNQACGLELWDGATDKGTMAYTVGNTNGGVNQLLNGGIHAIIGLTPAAGNHTYKICAWENIAGGNVTVFANTFTDGTGNIAPCAYRVTVIAYDPTLPS